MFESNHLHLHSLGVSRRCVDPTTASYKQSSRGTLLDNAHPISRLQKERDSVGFCSRATASRNLQPLADFVDGLLLLEVVGMVDDPVGIRESEFWTFDYVQHGLGVDH